MSLRVNCARKQELHGQYIMHRYVRKLTHCLTKSNKSLLNKNVVRSCFSISVEMFYSAFVDNLVALYICNHEQ